LTDLNSDGLLLIECKSRTQDKQGDIWVSKYQVRIYSGHEFIFSANLGEDPKSQVKFFGSLNYILELRKISEGMHHIAVYDFNNKLKVYSQNHTDVKFLETEMDLVYVMGGDNTSKQIY